MHQTRASGLRAWLSVLWAGDAPIAAHFGPLSKRVWHWWYPSYDPDYARHSPGLLMLHEMLKVAPGIGVKWLDFGQGKEDFKRLVANATIEVARGVVYTPWARLAFETNDRLRRSSRYQRAAARLRAGAGWLRRLRTG